MKNSDFDYDRLLNPKEVRATLFLSSAFITSYELCKEYLIDRIVAFFSDDIEEDSPVESEEYKLKVLSLSKSPLEASLQWYKNMNVINYDDIEIIQRARKTRNELAHDAFKIFEKSKIFVVAENLRALIEVIDKLFKWWFMEYEICINPYFDNMAIEEANVHSPLVSYLQMLMDIAFSEKEDMELFYQRYKSFVENKP